MKKKDVIFTPDDIDALFEFGEQIDEARDNISKSNSILATLVEGIRSTLQEGIPLSTETILYAARAIHDYVYRTDEIFTHLNEEYQKLYNEKRNICFGERCVAV